MCQKPKLWRVALAALFFMFSAAVTRAAPAAVGNDPAPVNLSAAEASAFEDVSAGQRGDALPLPAEMPPRAEARAPEASAGSMAPPIQMPQAPFRPRGPFVSVGYGLHRYSMKALSMEQDADARRTFDGGYLSVQAGYLAGWGGLIGLDWVHHSGKTNLNTQAGALSLRLRSDFVSLMAGIQLGGHVRFHLALLTGMAMSSFNRSVRVEEAEGEKLIERRDAHASSPMGFLVGLDMGLVVMPTTWLAIGLRARADRPLFDSDLAGTGGLYLGLTAAYVFPL